MDLSKAIDNFIKEAHDDPVEIAKICADHRQNRNDRYEGILLQPEYPGVPIDEILTARLNDPDYLDPRNNLCLFAWPSKEVIDLIARIQQELRDLAPNIWLSPAEWLHMTVIELAHSKPPEELARHVEQVKPHAAKLTAYATEHHAGLDRPMLSLDDTAVALTFLHVESDRYTYLHLRRDLANICADNGVEVSSKYYNTSCHITFARFAKTSDLQDKESLGTWVQKIQSINHWLKNEYWPNGDRGQFSPGLRWIVGAGRGIEVRKGRLWYGDGQPVIDEESDGP